MRYDVIDPELFIYNRKRFVREMKPNSLAIFHSNDLMPRNGDQCFPFRQNSDLFALTGIDQEETVLILYPDCIKKEYREILFIRETNAHIEIWEGARIDKATATEISGIDTVFWTKSYDQMLGMLMIMTNTVYLNSNETDKFSTEVQSRDMRFAGKLMQRFPLHHYVRAQPLLKRLAMIKSAFEVEQIKKAVDITGKAFTKVLRTIQPGIREYAIEAEIIAEFIRNGAEGHAFQPIVATGKNACVLHYTHNNAVCQEGDVVLLDFGAEYAHYAADMTRCVPVSGRFSDRQKAVYNAVLRVMKEAQSMLVPGTLLDDYHKEVGRIMESELIGLGLLSREEVKKQDPEKPLYKKYFMHGTSHHLGLDVHDLADKYTPIQDGMVFTCEPGIYIREENLGIRLENDILVTDNGPVDLMADIPLAVEEIEDAMQVRGVLH